MDKPLVSVVITTKNEEKNIKNCLEAIKRQTYKNIESIVVDNQSSDRTKEIAGEYTDMVFDKGPERSAQRNHGMIDQSHGEYVLFLDADMIMSPSVVQSCVEYIISHDGVKAIHIPEVVMGKRYFSKVRRFERSFYNGTVVDGARFFHKATFVDVGGFDETMSGPEDWDIDKKMKQVSSIGVIEQTKAPISQSDDWFEQFEEYLKARGVDPMKVDNAIFHNESEFDLGFYLKKKKYYSGSFDGYIAKWGKNDPDVKKQFGIGYRFFGVFLEKGKWKRLLCHPLMTFGMYFLRFLVGVTFMFRKPKKEGAESSSPYTQDR